MKKWMDTYASESDGYFYHITGGKKDSLATYEACYAMQWYLGFLKNGGSGHPYSLYADGFDFNKSFSKEANITSFKLEGKKGVIDEDAATITDDAPGEYFSERTDARDRAFRRCKTVIPGSALFLYQG